MCLYMQTKPPADDLEETEKRLLPVAGDPPHTSHPSLHMPPFLHFFLTLSLSVDLSLSPPVNEELTYLNHMPHDCVDRVSP